MRRRALIGLLGSATAVAAGTGLIYALQPIAPILSLGVLYTLPVLVTAVVFGLGYAIAVSLASMVAFNFLFLPPVHTLTLTDGRNWTALGVYVATAVIASELATRARRRAAVAEQRERETALLADAAAALLQAEPLDEIREHAERVLGQSDAIGRHRFEAAVSAMIAVADERRRVEELRRSDAIKTAVLQSVSHDFRTPLATVAAAVEGLESRDLTLSDADRSELLETIRLEVARLTRLVENLLDLSRLQAGAAAPHLALWPAEEIVASAVAETHGTERIELAFEDDLPAANIDEVQIQRVLVNLIENALKFSTGRVDVRARQDEGSLVVEVLDGGGAGAPGAGIGLQIARGFAAVNGGSVSLEPRTGGGTVARLTLPGVRLPERIKS